MLAVHECGLRALPRAAWAGRTPHGWRQLAETYVVRARRGSDHRCGCVVTWRGVDGGERCGLVLTDTWGRVEKTSVQ